ncbi:MAG TPA: helix-turn-helix transcriptional regulator [Stackebrandtia sp.]|uniref:helix-turn-helix domain-containing protein n=1 Tax=Stackebrandtia sp. TaxID=2023065 RepID=UPI002D242B3F|nr:helix-turn-helix transcriptional regulator [Stackebrandtia sp.]HZE40534.1 helix-turn-helix transcriptional regulator [Stackebrandtia sp.]
MAKNKALSLRVQWLGDRLRQARDAAGFTLEDAAEYLQIRGATLSRFENGVYRPKPSYVRDLVDFYGISDEPERAVLLQLNEDAWRKDVWIGNAKNIDKDFIDYAWLEARASKVCVFEPLLIHGLLHTPAYAEALATAGLGDSAPREEIERTATVRAKRQTILDGDKPCELSVVLEETPLRRAIGDPTTQAAQLKHLIDAGRKSNIDIRVLPRRGRWHPGLDGPFTLIDMPDPYPDVVYIETLVGRTFLEDEAKVDQYRQAYDRLHEQALAPRESTKLIREVMREIE